MNYDRAYCETMLRLNTDSAEAINRRRWDFAEPAGARVVLDYGCGCNFLTAYAPPGVTVDSFDVGDYPPDLVTPPTGIQHMHYDLMCLFDVIEHVDWNMGPVPDRLMLSALHSSTYLAISLPILPPETDLAAWKHYKPGEHLTYFTEASLLLLMARHGFLPLRCGVPECPPRSDIQSFLFRRVG